MDNETQLFNKRLLIRNKINTNLIGKIPKCTKNISIPKNVNNKNSNKKTLLPSKQSSTSSLKNTNYNSKKNSSRKSIPFIQTRNIHSSIQNFNQILQKKELKNNIYNRIFSRDKIKNEKNDESSNTSRKNINIDHLYNYKIEYYLLKDNIQKILRNQIDKDNIDVTNKIMGEIIIKLKKIMEKINEHSIKNKEGKKKSNIKEGYNKKLLTLYEEKYNKEYEKLKDLSDSNYINRINTELTEVQNRINYIEKENKELLLDNQFNKTNKIFNTIKLPNIKKTKTINNIIKNEENINMEKQLQNKIKEYKNQIGQELLISKKIKDNELNLKKYEEIINNLNIKYNTLQNNFEKGIFTEEDNLNECECENIYIKENLPMVDVNVKNIDKNNNEINIIDENISEEKDKGKKKPKNELVLIEKKRISKINKKNELISLLDKKSNDDIPKNKDKDTKNKNKNITLDDISKFEENHNILSLPCPTSKKKNLSCANVTSNINISNNKTIKELILKNLDQKEKEEKALINIHENDTLSSNKFKHIKLKPNFSFNNDYYLFKDEKIKKIPKLQSSVENKSKKIVNLYNNNNKDKEELINESINIDESSTKNNDTNNKNNEYLIKLNYNFNSNNNNNSNIITKITNDKDDINNSFSEINSKRIMKKRKNPDLIGRNLISNNINNMIIMPSTKNKNNQINKEEEEKKNDHFSTYGEQREKVLNTIMYDDIVEQGSIL